MKIKLCSLMLVFCLLAIACDNKMVVSYEIAGKTLIETHRALIEAKNNNLISQEKYNKIMPNFLKAADIHYKAGDALLLYLNKQPNDYLNLITQFNIIIADIVLWIKEGE